MILYKRNSIFGLTLAIFLLSEKYGKCFGALETPNLEISASDLTVNEVDVLDEKAVVASADLLGADSEKESAVVESQKTSIVASKPDLSNAHDIIESINNAVRKTIRRSSTMVKLTIQQKADLLHELEDEIREQEIFFKQLEEFAGAQGLVDLQAPFQITKDAFKQYYETIPAAYEFIENVLQSKSNKEEFKVPEPSVYPDFAAGPKPETKRRLKNKQKKRFASSSGFNQYTSSSKSFIPKKPRQNPYKYKEPLVTRKNFHHHIHHSLNQGHARRLSVHETYADFLDPAFVKGHPILGKKQKYSQQNERRANGWPTPPPTASKAPSPSTAPVEFFESNCELLKECVERMSLYDMFVLFCKSNDWSFIEKVVHAPISQLILQFSLVSDDIDPDDGTLDFDDDDVEANFRLFDEEDLIGKFERVKESLDTLDTSNLTECSSLLQEFHRNVEVDLVNNWEGSSVSQVCLAEGTTVYVRFDEIARVNELVAEEGLFGLKWV